MMPIECSEINQNSYHNSLNPQQQRGGLSSDQNVATPLYAKNPNMTNNKIGEILEISRDNKQFNKAITGADNIIVPSPSGITRCYVKYDEKPTNLNSVEVKQPFFKDNTVNITYTNIALKGNHLLGYNNRVDSSTSPFVVLNSNNGKQVRQKDEVKNAGFYTFSWYLYSPVNSSSFVF